MTKSRKSMLSIPVRPVHSVGRAEDRLSEEETGGSNSTSCRSYTSSSVTKACNERCQEFIRHFDGFPGANQKEKTYSYLHESCNSILFIFHCFGLRFPEADDPIYYEKYIKSYCKFFSSLFWHTQCDADDQAWVKFLKNRTLRFVSHYTNQDMPASLDGTNPRYLFGGIIGQWARSFLQTAKKKIRYEFLNSLLMCKKGMPPVSEAAVRKAEIATVEKLTDPKNIGCPEFSIIKSELRRTVCEVLPENSCPESFEIQFPSTSANATKSRKQGGLVSIVLDEYIARCPLSSLVRHCRLSGVGIEVNHGFGMKDLLERESVFERLGNETQAERSVEITLLDLSNLSAIRRNLHSVAVTKALEESSVAYAVGLPEPFKVRVITKGSPHHQLALHPIQKFLWRTLKSQPVFAMIGRPLTIDDIRRVCTYEWCVSGDYTSSTDNIHSWVSEVVWCEIVRHCKFPDWVRVLGIDALTRHHVSVTGLPDDNCDCLPNQTVGQLMGSIISFPVLCIINAAMCRFALEESHQRRFSLKPSRQNEIPLLINGDDCLLSGPTADLAEYHEIAAKQVGWSLSPGKNSVSTEFCTLNSTMFLRESGSWDLVPYVNLGLLYGRQKSGSLITDPVCLADVHNDLLDTCPDHLRERLSRAFVVRHFKELTSAEVPWYLPRAFGGLGMKGGFISDFDRSVARYVLQKGIRLESFNEPEWLTHRLVRRYLDSLGCREESLPFYRDSLSDPRLVGWEDLIRDSSYVSQEEMYDAAYGSLVFLSLYEAKNGGGERALEKLLRKQSVGKHDLIKIPVHAHLKKMSFRWRKWCRWLKGQQYVRPLSDEELSLTGSFKGPVLLIQDGLESSDFMHDWSLIDVEY